MDQNELVGGRTDPVLIAVGGLPGSGKSVVAGMLAERLGARRLRTDVIRKELYTSPQYDEEENDQVYAELFKRAAGVLVQGNSAVLDATFQRQDQRSRAQMLASEQDASFWFVRVTAPEALVRQRLGLRRNDASDAGFDVYLYLKDRFEPVSMPHRVIDNAGTLAELARQVDALLVDPGRNPSAGSTREK